MQKALLYNSQSALINDEIDLFLLSVLQTEILPPKILFLLSSCKNLSQLLLKTLFSQEPTQKTQVFPSGLSLSRYLMSSTPVVLLEAQGNWDYNSELIGIGLSHLVIAIMEYEHLDDFQIETFFDILIRLETSREEKRPFPRDLVIYLVNSPENWSSEQLKTKTTEGFRRKWDLFPKTQFWGNFPMESVFSVEVKSFQINKNTNKTDYVPIGYLTKSHSQDLTMPELHCLPGISEEILRMAKEGQEYLYFDELRRKCSLLQTKRVMKMLLKEFQGEISFVKKEYERKVFEKLKTYSHELLNKLLSRFEMRTTGIKNSSHGEKDVSEARQELKDQIMKELFTISNAQRVLILSTAEIIFNNEINNIMKKFKETKSASLLIQANTRVLENVETSLQNVDLRFLIAERSPLIKDSIDKTNYGEVINLEELMVRFNSKIQNLIENERKNLLNEATLALNKDSLKILESSMKGEELLLGKEFWRRLNKKLQTVQSNLFSTLRKQLINLQISESMIEGELEKIMNNQKAFLDFELEKRKYRLEDFIFQGFQDILNRKINEHINTTYLLEKRDLNQREMVLRELKGFCKSMAERIEESVKELRYMEAFEGKLWLTAEEINLIILSLRQNLEKITRELESRVKALERKVFFKRIGILMFFILLFVFVFLFMRGFYIKIVLALIFAGGGVFLSKLIPLKRRKKIFVL